MSEKVSHILPSPKNIQSNGSTLSHHHHQQQPQHPSQTELNARRQMPSHLPPFNMPPGPRTFSPTPGFDNKPEQSQHSMMSKFPPNPANSASGGGPQGPSPGQSSHEYGQQGPSSGPQGFMNNGMGYWPNPNQQNPPGQVPFPNQQNPSSHLPSLYGNMSQQSSQNYSYPPRPASSNPVPRSGSPHAEPSGGSLPPPQQIHEGYGHGQQQQQQHHHAQQQQQQPQQQGQQQHPGAGPNSGNPQGPGGYPMYVPQYGGGGNQPGPTNIYGGPAAGAYGGYPSQPYGGPSNGPAGGQYGGMYSNQMPHSREGSQDTSQWQRSPYGPTQTYSGGPGVADGYNGGYSQASMASQQAPYVGGRAGRGASNTGERPFKCDQCPQSFQRSHDLKRHKRIHLAIKPFPCPSCDKSFSRKDALKRHILVKGCGNTSS